MNRIHSRTVAGLDAENRTQVICHELRPRDQHLAKSKQKCSRKEHATPSAGTVVTLVTI